MERVCRSSVCAHKALSCFSALNPAGPPAPPAPPKAPAPAGLGTPKGCQRSQIEQQKSVRSKVSLKLSMSRSCCSSKFTLASWLQPILPPWNRCPAQFPSSCPAPPSTQHPPITPCSILPFLPPNHSTIKCLHLPCTEITLRSSPFIKTLPNTNFPHLAKNEC